MANATLCLSLDAIQASVETTIRAVRGEGTQVREPSHSSRQVSRGTRNTIKIIKIKIYTRLQENHKKKGVYPITPPIAGWAGPTSS